MGKLKLEAKERVERDQRRGQEIVEHGEQKLEEARVNSLSLGYEGISVIDDLEAIHDDDITALMECGRQYSVEELVEQFGISVDAAKSVLVPCDHVDIAKAIAETENAEAIVSIFDTADEHEVTELSDRDMSLEEIAEFTDEELARMVYELEHAFD